MSGLSSEPGPVQQFESQRFEPSEHVVGVAFPGHTSVQSLHRHFDDSVQVSLHAPAHDTAHVVELLLMRKAMVCPSMNMPP